MRRTVGTGPDGPDAVELVEVGTPPGGRARVATGRRESERPARWACAAAVLVALGALAAPTTAPRATVPIVPRVLLTVGYLAFEQAATRDQIVAAAQGSAGIAGGLRVTLDRGDGTVAQVDGVWWVSRLAPGDLLAADVPLTEAEGPWVRLLAEQAPRHGVGWVCERLPDDTAWCTSLDADPVVVILDLGSPSVTPQP